MGRPRDNRIEGEQAALDALRRVVKAHPTKADVAKELAISSQHLADVLAGRRKMGHALLKRLGFRRVLRYEAVA